MDDFVSTVWLKQKVAGVFNEPNMTAVRWCRALAASATGSDGEVRVDIIVCLGVPLGMVGVCVDPQLTANGTCVTLSTLCQPLFQARAGVLTSLLPCPPHFRCTTVDDTHFYCCWTLTFKTRHSHVTELKWRDAETDCQKEEMGPSAGPSWLATMTSLPSLKVALLW